MASEKILMVVLAVVFGLIQAGELPENDPSGYYRPPCKWGSWSKCSKTCGGGTQQRKCTYEYPYGRRTPYYPNYRVQTRPCNTNCCPVNGGFSAWTKWGDCGRNCYQVRRRYCTNPKPRCGGKKCRGPRRLERRCSRPYCAYYQG
ncbi:netrin receptor UNC5A [Exaiptasia diaphana]|uniref:Uncharacterized protein n=1 Tax=Exaiptasia diaphana TaxID=2652724 RepID=A0A913X3S8_EXADI|nr:netrin receptor UNC5A [Exaiptasia diaphana]